jgi:hypothetical protein
MSQESAQAYQMAYRISILRHRFPLQALLPLRVTSSEGPGAFECETAVTPLPLRLGEYVADSDCASITSTLYESRFEGVLLIVAGAWMG